MDFKSLRYFIAVAEEENLRRASQRLHIAQSALSRQISKLEFQLSVRLFGRSHGKVWLSEAGRAYLAEARRILESAEDAALRSRRIERGEVGNLRIAASEASLRVPCVKSIVETFVRTNPDIQLRIFSVRSIGQFDLLRSGEIDAAFAYPHPAHRTQFFRLPVAKLSVEVAMPSAHRLARRPKLKLADLAGERLIMKNPSASDTGTVHRMMAAFVSCGFRPKVACEVDRTDVALGLVSAGAGMSILSRAMDEPPFYGVAFRRISDLAIPVAMELLWKKSDLAVLDRFTQVARQVTLRYRRVRPQARKSGSQQICPP